mgnify:CR=1 FL=1
MAADGGEAEVALGAVKALGEGHVVVVAGCSPLVEHFVEDGLAEATWLQRGDLPIA